MTIRERNKERIERIADVATRWIGSTSSLVFHTFMFIVAFLLPTLHIMPFDKMLLILTTIVSLEAIYLAIFIQMSVNKNSQDIVDIQENIEEIQEDVEEMQEDVEEIQEDVEEIQEDVEEIQEDVEELQEDMDEDEVIEKKEEANNILANNQNKDSKMQRIDHIKQLITQLQSELDSLK